MPYIQEAGVIDGHNKGLQRETDEILERMYQRKAWEIFLTALSQNIDSCVEVGTIEGVEDGTE